MPPKRKQHKKRVPRQKQRQSQSQKIVINNTTRRHYSNVPQKRPAEPSRRDIINIPVPQWGIPAQFDSNAGLVSALTGITELLKKKDEPIAKVNTIGGNPPKVPEHVTKPILKSTEMQTNLSHFVPQEKGTFVQKKRGGGRPKGSKNKPKFPQQPSLD